MRALVTGASGFIGSHLVSALLQAGWQVTAASRRPLAPPADAMRFTTVPVTDQGLAHLEHAYDVVFHIAGVAHEAVSDAERASIFAFNHERTVAFYRAAIESRVGRFVWLSSSKVLGECSHEPLAVTAALRPHGAYAESKARAEDALLEIAGRSGGATRLAIVRPPLVYGPGVGANFRRLLGWSVAGYPLPFGAARAPRSWVGVARLVNTLMDIAGYPGEQPVWHIKDPADRSLADMMRAIAAAAQRQLVLWPIPEPLMRVALAAVGQKATAARLYNSMQLDDAPTRAAFPAYVSYDVNSAVTRTVHWYLTQRS